MLGHTRPWQHREKGLELHPAAHWISWLQDDWLNYHPGLTTN